MTPRKKSKTYNEKYGIILSQNPYFRLTIPPGIWFGFKGISEGLNLICNVADIPHDPDEVLRKEINQLGYNNHRFDLIHYYHLFQK